MSTSSRHLLKSEYQTKNSIYFESKRSDMLSRIPQDSTVILEVGCGYGNFAKLLKENLSAEIWGIEIDESAAQIAANHFDKLICDAFSRELNLPVKNFDCIIFNDVLEHLVDPFDALLYCKDLLCKDGIVVASIPNVRYFDNIWHLLVDKNWDYKDSGILDKTHLRFFTRRSIVETFERLGYGIKTIEGISPLEQVHPHWNRRFKFLNWLFRNHLEDMRYLQFAVVAYPKCGSHRE